MINIHNNKKKLNIELCKKKNKLQKQKENLLFSKEEELLWLNQLAKFELGRFLIFYGNLDYKWRSYLLLSEETQDMHPLERWLLTKGPNISAARERFPIFRQQIQKYLQSNMKIASIPCGMGYEILNLNYVNIENVKCVCIDCDPNALAIATNNAIAKHINNVEFYQTNILQIDQSQEFELIISNMFTFYEQKIDKIKLLYQKIHQALKEDGILITSFSTVSPTENCESSWINYSIDCLIKEMAILKDILDVQFLPMQTEKEMINLIKGIGFEIMDIAYDKRHIFPTVIAKKIST